MSILWNKIIGHKDKISFVQEALKKRRLAQTLLFSGNPGIGKKLFALSLSQSLICEKSRNPKYESILPCGQCLDCLKVEEMQSEHIFLIQPEDEKEIKRKDILQIFNFLSLKSSGALPRIVLIHKAHKMTPSSAHTLLKILEEPPKNSFLFLMTDSFFRILPTIRSRSQNFLFRNFNREEIKLVLKNKGLSKVDPWMFSAFQSFTDGSQKLSHLKLLRKKAFSSLKCILIYHEAEKAFESIESEITEKEKSLKLLLFWKQLLRDTYIYKLLKSKEDILIHKDELSFIEDLSLKKSLDQLQALFSSIQKLEKDISYNLNRALSFKNFIFSNKNNPQFI